MNAYACCFQLRREPLPDLDPEPRISQEEKCSTVRAKNSFKTVWREGNKETVVKQKQKGDITYHLSKLPLIVGILMLRLHKSPDVILLSYTGTAICRKRGKGVEGQSLVRRH